MAATTEKAMQLYGQFQNSYVTRDVERATEQMAQKFGIDRAKIDRFQPEMVVKTLDGDKPLHVNVSSFWIGGLNIEVIQPMGGYTDHYTSLLPADEDDWTPRFHHISIRRDDEAAMRAEIAELGFPLAFEGPLSIKDPIPSLIFIYLDARDTLGHYVEFTWKSPEAWDYVGWPKDRPFF